MGGRQADLAAALLRHARRGVTQLVQTDSTLLWAPFPTPELPNSVSPAVHCRRAVVQVSPSCLRMERKPGRHRQRAQGSDPAGAGSFTASRLNAEANRLTVGLKKNFQ